ITGNLLAVTENPRDALGQLATSGNIDKSVWIDAVCIDQSNSDEKGIQVALISEIYSRASQAIVWLGSDTSDHEDFLWLNNEFLAGIGLYI
ncbi:heterokaryon incompatibility protein-domain-containing protein, partial [Leptodontidium sp. 2 PMI_412]